MNKIIRLAFPIALGLALTGGVNAATVAQKRVYVSVGADVVKHLKQQKNTLIDIQTEASLKAAEADYHTVSIPASQVSRLSEIIHQEFMRCPGFFMHDSREAAVAFNQPATAAKQRKQVNYTIDNSETAYALLNNVSSDQLSATVQSLSSYHNRYYNATTGADASQWIKNKWQSIATGRDDITVEYFEHPAWRQPSVMVTITGTDTPDEYVIAGGHLDSINNSNTSLNAPGADDNASGIAVLTNTLDTIVASNYRPAKTVVLIGYAAEEVGLRGSQVIANDFKNKEKNVVGVVQFDMTGFQGSSSDIVFINDFTNGPQNEFMTQLVDTYMPDINYSFDICGYACSDHASWTKYGFAASFPFEAPFGQHNSTIHSTEDLSFDADHAVKFLRLSVVYLAELAKGGVNVEQQVKGSVTFSTSEVTVEEGNSVTLTVERVAGQDAQVSIDYATQDGTAIAGSDYIATSGTLTWSNQDNASQTITIDTNEVDSHKTFEVVLSNPQGGVQLGATNTITVKIGNKVVEEPTPTEPAEPVRVNSGGGGTLSSLWLGVLALCGFAARRRG